MWSTHRWLWEIKGNQQWSYCREQCKFNLFHSFISSSSFPAAEQNKKSLANFILLYKHGWTRYSEEKTKSKETPFLNRWLQVKFSKKTCFEWSRMLNRCKKHVDMLMNLIILPLSTLKLVWLAQVNIALYWWSTSKIERILMGNQEWRCYQIFPKSYCSTCSLKSINMWLSMLALTRNIIVREKWLTLNITTAEPWPNHQNCPSATSRYPRKGRHWRNVIQHKGKWSRR